MIRIALCDDKPDELGGILEMVERYQALRPQYEIAAAPYHSPLELLAETEHGKFHDIYILDILMPGMGGIELGRRIREQNRTCSILFSTVTPEYALDAYSVQAQNYLVKPFKEEELYRSLDRAVFSIAEQQAKGIGFRAAEGMVFLPYNQISYIELVGRRMEFHQTGGPVIRSLVLRGTFEGALGGLLSDPRFLQTHKSFVVNMDYIHMCAGYQMTLNDGTAVPMSIRRQNAAMNRYFTYLSAR